MHFGWHFGSRDRAFSSNSWTLLRTLAVPVYVQSPTCKTPVVYAYKRPDSGIKMPIPLRRNATVLAIAQAAACKKASDDPYDHYDADLDQEEDDFFFSDVGDDDADPEDMSGEEMLMYVSGQKRF